MRHEFIEGCWPQELECTGSLELELVVSQGPQPDSLELELVVSQGPQPDSHSLMHHGMESHSPQ